MTAASLPVRWAFPTFVARLHLAARLRLLRRLRRRRHVARILSHLEAGRRGDIGLPLAPASFLSDALLRHVVNPNRTP